MVLGRGLLICWGVRGWRGGSGGGLGLGGLG